VTLAVITKEKATFAAAKQNLAAAQMEEGKEKSEKYSRPAAHAARAIQRSDKERSYGRCRKNTESYGH
jgi:hypothetical protein